MRRQTLRVLCTATLIAAVALAPAPAFARPVRPAPTLDARVEPSAVTLGESFTPLPATGASPKAASPLAGGVTTLAASAFPGDPVQWLDANAVPITGAVDASGSAWAYYSVYLEAGEQVAFELYGDGTSADLDLYLYDPTNALADDGDGNNTTSTESISGDVNVGGTWSIAVNAASGADTFELYGLFASPDDDIPGVQIPSSPVVTTLDSYSDWDDVYRIWLNAGDVLTVSLSRGTYSGAFYPNLYLYTPGTTTVWDPGAPVEGREGLTFPKTVTYGVPTSGYYYVDIYELAGTLEDASDDTHDHGEAILAWRISAPVYRFFNFTNNTHFFTPSLTEANMVIARWPNIYRYEGVAYTTNPANNTTPLIRLYNRVSGSHFYTANAAEATDALARWPHVFSWDGPTYAVNPVPVSNSLPVYRFYNVRNGSHFFTASAAEADMVIATWPTVYRFEGPAFWIGQ